ncbi:DUF2834 domain-containing protein [Argonema antarcticum]|uniref:DUF2834 domain-containing protein n=1 Tax=Argonema antarcticum TaxID=2942763 RepID=UPI0020119012|nr:DUF2834 domain-containing protein [Argonema antarcticum]MCL1472856.1 DUF2834 domain-containing protein [Argonema antarcticum A004/B2]
MNRKVTLFLIWVLFVSYTVWLAPLDRPDTLPLVQKLLTLQWGNLNPIIPVLFILMGVWPMIYACLMFFDGKMQKFMAWPYFIGSNGTGVICLLPYLFLRDRNQEFTGQKDYLLRILDKRSTGIALLLSTIALFAYGLIAGDWADYFQQFQTTPFVQLISIDFCLMCLVFPLTSLFDDDMARRGIKDSQMFWVLALVPLFGPLVYLCLRPPIPAITLETVEKLQMLSLTSAEL